MKELEETERILNVHDMATANMTIKQKRSYYNEHKTVKPFYEFGGFSNLVFGLKLNMSDILTRKKCKRGGVREKTRQKVLAPYEKLRVESLWKEGYSLNHIYASTWITPYSARKFLIKEGIYEAPKTYTTREEWLEYKKKSKVKWNLWVYREGKKRGLSDEEIDDRRKKKPYWRGYVDV